MLGIVIPAYKANRFLEEAVLSVLDQPLVDLVTVVDDCCPSRCSDTIIPLIKKYKGRLHVVRLVTNRGQYVAINTGISILKKNQADFVGILDADDRAHRNRFETTLALFEKKPEVMAISGLKQLIDENGRVLSGVEGQEYPTDPSTIIRLRYGPSMILSSSTFRMSVFDMLGGFDCTWGGSDTQFTVRMYYAKLPMLFVHSIFGDYRIHSGQSTKNMHTDEVRKAYHQKAGGEWLYWKLLQAKNKLGLHHVRTRLEIEEHTIIE